MTRRPGPGRAPVWARVGLLLARVCCSALPSAWLFALARGAAPLLYMLVPPLRRALRANARHLLGPDASEAALRSNGLGVLGNFGRSTIELLKSQRRLPAGPELFETMRGREHFERARAAGRGIIGATLHIGNFEAGPMLLAKLVQPLAIVYSTDPVGVFERTRSRRRSAEEMREIAIDRSPFFGVEVLAILRQNGIALLAVDVAFGAGDGELFSFLGAPAPFLTWPAKLSLASGAPILPCFIVRDAQGAYRLEICAPVFPDANATERTIMERLLPTFERMVRRYPDQWLIVTPYWPEDQVTVLPGAPQA